MFVRAAVASPSSESAAVHVAGVESKGDRAAEVEGGGAVGEAMGSVWEVLKLAKKERVRVVCGVFGALLSAGILLLTPAALGRVLDAVAKGAEARRSLYGEGMLLLGLYVIGAAAKFVEVAMLRLAGERIVFDLRMRVMGKLVGSDVAEIEKSSAGMMLSRLQSDSYDFQAVVTKDLPSLVTGFFESVLGFAILWRLCPPLFPVVAATVPLTVVAANFYGKRTARVSKRLSAALARASDVASEQLGGIRVVKAFAREALAIEKYRGALAEVTRNGNLVAVADGTMQAWNRLVFTVKTVAVLLLGAAHVASGALTVGGLFSFAIYTSNIAAAMGKFTGGWGELVRSSGSIARVLEILATKPVIEEWEEKASGSVDACLDGMDIEDGEAVDAGAAAARGVAGNIEFRNVTFSYPSRRTQTPALSDMSFKIPAGSSVAICGRSGGGKSTMAALLSRFHDPTSGTVLIDGKPIDEYTLKHLRGNLIGLVPQNAVLFTGSIRDNIEFGKPGASKEEVETAALDAGVMEFASRLPKGLDTPVGPSVGTLSGGEKQRVMIARCLCKRPRILLLDEATSALDAASEAMVNASIEKLMKNRNRTVVLISHRLSIAKRCDNILVLERGVLRESGSPHVLAEDKTGLYAELLAVAGDSID